MNYLHNACLITSCFSQRKKEKSDQKRAFRSDTFCACKIYQICTGLWAKEMTLRNYDLLDYLNRSVFYEKKWKIKYVNAILIKLCKTFQKRDSYWYFGRYTEYRFYHIVIFKYLKYQSIQKYGKYQKYQKSIESIKIQNKCMEWKHKLYFCQATFRTLQEWLATCSETRDRHKIYTGKVI